VRSGGRIPAHRKVVMKVKYVGHKLSIAVPTPIGATTLGDIKGHLTFKTDEVKDVEDAEKLVALNHGAFELVKENAPPVIPPYVAEEVKEEAPTKKRGRPRRKK